MGMSARRFSVRFGQVWVVEYEYSQTPTFRSSEVRASCCCDVVVVVVPSPPLARWVRSDRPFRGGVPPFTRSLPRRRRRRG